jgi:hypothetical protein
MQAIITRGGKVSNAWRATRNAQFTGATGPSERAGWLFWADQDCGQHSDFSCSHLWSHSHRFRGVRSGLPSLGSGATRPNRTGLNHQPQNSKAREVKASEGSNPSATATLIAAGRRRRHRRRLQDPTCQAGPVLGQGRAESAGGRQLTPGRAPDGVSAATQPRRRTRCADRAGLEPAVSSRPGRPTRARPAPGQAPAPASRRPANRSVRRVPWRRG